MRISLKKECLSKYNFAIFKRKKFRKRPIISEPMFANPTALIGEKWENVILSLPSSEHVHQLSPPRPIPPPRRRQQQPLYLPSAAVDDDRSSTAEVVDGIKIVRFEARHHWTKERFLRGDGVGKYAVNEKYDDYNGNDLSIVQLSDDDNSERAAVVTGHHSENSDADECDGDIENDIIFHRQSRQLVGSVMIAKDNNNNSVNDLMLVNVQRLEEREKSLVRKKRKLPTSVREQLESTSPLSRTWSYPDMPRNDIFLTSFLYSLSISFYLGILKTDDNRTDFYYRHHHHHADHHSNMLAPLTSAASAVDRKNNNNNNNCTEETVSAEVRGGKIVNAEAKRNYSSERKLTDKIIDKLAGGRKVFKGLNRFVRLVKGKFRQDSTSSRHEAKSIERIDRKSSDEMKIDPKNNRFISYVEFDFIASSAAASSYNQIGGAGCCCYSYYDDDDESSEDSSAVNNDYRLISSQSADLISISDSLLDLAYAICD